ncbi:MAG: glutamine--fructose-6-phosphate transaminase (isomerizing) [Chloroflexi bacterium]|nr:glutamine--fructose-6-phosphate transaminase (isomerizing) [Chloroflexota bacterium]
MCGIFGYVGRRDEAPQLVLAGLKKLEYRGYDSWGIAAHQNNGRSSDLLVEKHVGKIGQAVTALSNSHAALGHTRWATHGGVTEPNAHPHLDCAGRLAIIHNGIVENHAELKHDLLSRGHRFKSQTDTEVVAHLLEDELRDPEAEACEALANALMRVFKKLDGLSAIGVLDSQAQCIAAVKNGSPLVLGWGQDGNYLASDSSALLDHTRRLAFVEDGEAALVTADQVTLYDVATGVPIEQPRIWQINWQEATAELDGYPDFMSKEIHEQPSVLRRVAEERYADARRLAEDVAGASTVHLVGCGSAAHAARCGEYMFSRLAMRQANCVVGSEFSYLADFLDARSLVVGLSQSGETIDLLDSVKAARRRGARLAALVNVEGSSLYRLVDHPILLAAGPERCVLATKSFTAKLAVLLMSAYAARGEPAEGLALVRAAADEIDSLLQDERAEQLKSLAQRFARCDHLYAIGRGPSYPMALEAALKIKEVSYIHAEGFPGGELKHGVIALIEPGTPCLVIAPNDETFRAILSGAEEIKARGGFIIGISPLESDVWDEHVRIADVGEASSIVTAVPPQLLAYYLARARGLDPDKPRNLAKSVTVK